MSIYHALTPHARPCAEWFTRLLLTKTCSVGILKMRIHTQKSEVTSLGDTFSKGLSQDCINNTELSGSQIRNPWVLTTTLFCLPCSNPVLWALIPTPAFQVWQASTAVTPVAPAQRESSTVLIPLFPDSWPDTSWLLSLLCSARISRWTI